MVTHISSPARTNNNNERPSTKKRDLHDVGCVVSLCRRVPCPRSKFVISRDSAVALGSLSKRQACTIFPSHVGSLDYSKTHLRADTHDLSSDKATRVTRTDRFKNLSRSPRNQSGGLLPRKFIHTSCMNLWDWFTQGKLTPLVKSLSSGWLVPAAALAAAGDHPHGNPTVIAIVLVIGADARVEAQLLGDLHDDAQQEH